MIRPADRDRHGRVQQILRGPAPQRHEVDRVPPAPDEGTEDDQINRLAGLKTPDDWTNLSALSRAAVRLRPVDSHPLAAEARRRVEKAQAEAAAVALARAAAIRAEADMLIGQYQRGAIGLTPLWMALEMLDAEGPQR